MSSESELTRMGRAVGDDVGVDPLVIAGLLAVVLQALQTCLPTPARAAAWLRQDTPAVRGVIRRQVAGAWQARGGDIVMVPTLVKAVVKHCRTITAKQVARAYAEIQE